MVVINLIRETAKLSGHINYLKVNLKPITAIVRLNDGIYVDMKALLSCLITLSRVKRFIDRLK